MAFLRHGISDVTLLLLPDYIQSAHKVLQFIFVDKLYIAVIGRVGVVGKLLIQYGAATFGNKPIKNLFLKHVHLHMVDLTNTYTGKPLPNSDCIAEPPKKGDLADIFGWQLENPNTVWLELSKKLFNKVECLPLRNMLKNDGRVYKSDRVVRN